MQNSSINTTCVLFIDSINAAHQLSNTEFTGKSNPFNLSKFKETCLFALIIIKKVKIKKASNIKGDSIFRKSQTQETPTKIGTVLHHFFCFSSIKILG